MSATPTAAPTPAAAGPTPAGPPPAPLTQVGVRRLSPETTKIFEGSFAMLHCEVKGDQLYRAVFAVRLFPVNYPNRFISLHYTDIEDKDREKEIGVIEDLSVFSKEEQALLNHNLAQQYYEQIIERVYEIKEEYGILFFTVQTQRGREEFVMPWRGDRADDYGDNGKVLFDALDNRYIIPDVDELPRADQRRFTSYIYW